MNVSGVMPVKGRTAETIDLVPRLISTAGAPLEMVMVIDSDPEIASAVGGMGWSIGIITNESRHGYWRSMSDGAKKTTGALIVNLANDILPGREWLIRAVEAYGHRFGSGLGIIGFNDGIHQGTHAGHFMIHRDLLREWYGEDLWPLEYDHLWADTEIVQRAIALKIFAVAPWAVLYHNHPASGKMGDPVYAIGHAKIDQDRATFERRKAAGWR